MRLSRQGPPSVRKQAIELLALSSDHVAAIRIQKTARSRFGSFKSYSSSSSLLSPVSVRAMSRNRDRLATDDTVSSDEDEDIGPVHTVTAETIWH